MPGRVDEVVFISEEEKAEQVVIALKETLPLEPTEDNLERIQRNAKHLQIVIDSLDISAAKRKEYQKLISDHLVE